MADRTVSVRLQAVVTDYMAKMSAASKATAGLAHEVDIAKGKAAQGFHTIGVAGVAMGTVVAGGFAVAIKSAADFDAKMALVRTLSHATAGEMSQLRDAALTVGQAYGYSAGQVADAEAELVKAGVSVSDIMGGALAGALTLAAAGQTDVAEATTIAATAMTQFQLSGKDVPHIADLLAAGADKALGSVGDLGYALDQSGLTAHQFGISIEETVGTLAAFAQAGQVGERGGTVFAQVLARLAAPGKQAAQILKDLQINAYDAGGNFVGLANLAGQLHDKMANLTLAERNHDLQVIFGQRAIRGANILYQEGAKGIEDWTKAVNDSGFAQLQAAGKLDSLSGDLTKLKTALQAAFIGAGEGSQGPLRTMVQDVTQAVEVWNELPGPVKGAAEALMLAGGAVTLAGGAALLFIPKWTAMNAALVASGRSAISARAALSGLGKASVLIAGLTAVDYALERLHKALQDAPPEADALTSSLLRLGDTGQVTGQLKDVMSQLDLLAQMHPMRNAGQGTRDELDAIGQSLAGLVQSGHLDEAQAAFNQISQRLQAAGQSTSEIAQLFPDFNRALADSATQAKLSADGVDDYGNAVSQAARDTKKATDAAKAYSDQLHALGDPLFAMNQALQGVTDAQHAATVAVHKYGADSPQARQANLDLASSALDAEAAARTLAAAVKNGSVSIGDARKFLKQWVADGLLTKQQADDVSSSFDHLIGRAKTISGLHPHVKVTADTSQAEDALSNLLVHIGNVISGFLTLGSVSSGSINAQGGVGSSTYGPTVPKQNSGGRSSTSDARYYVPSGSGGSGAGSGSGSGRGAKERPPTVQEIVHAILTGTIPPSIDKLSHVLQSEIRHLTTTVGNAQQYRSTVRSNLLGYASLSNAQAPTDAYGRVMGGAKVNSYLKGRLAQLKQFVHLRHRLEKEGAGQALLHEFEEIGPDANPMMRQLLSGGRSAIRHANRLEHQIGHLAGKAASEAATDRYGPQIIHELRRLPQQEAKAIVKGLRHQHIDVSVKDLAKHHGNRVRSKS